MGTDGQDPRRDFLAAPREVDDWRVVVLTDAALQAGILAALPGSAEDVAERLGLDAHAVRVVLDALREWEVVVAAEVPGHYDLGPASAAGDRADVLRHHARVIHRWSAALPDCLRGDTPAERTPRSPEQRESWMRALATNARRVAPGVADRSLERFPGVRRVLDVAGGHGEYGLEFDRRGLDVTLQDLPDMLELVGRWPALRDSRVRLFGSDAFDELPDGPFDLVVCAGFTHTQPADRVEVLLARLRAVTARGGGIAIQTLLRDERPTGPIFAVQMLVGGGGGDTHGWAEYRRWLAAAGYEDAERAETGGRSLILASAGVI